MVESVGKKLHQARLQRGLTIDEAAHATKLRPDKIAALESDDYSRFANNIYAKGFLQIYGRFLKVDVEDFARTLDNANPISIGDYQYLSNAPIPKSDPNPMRVENGRRPPSLAPLLVFIVLVGGGLGALWISQEYKRIAGDSQARSTEQPGAPENGPKPSPNPDAAFISETASAAPKAAPATPASIPRSAATPAPASASAPAVPAPAAPGTLPSPVIAPSPGATTPTPLAAGAPRAVTPAPVLPGNPPPTPANPAEQDFVTAAPVPGSENPVRPAGTNIVLVATVRKTKVTVRKDDPKAPPIFEDYVYPNERPLTLKGARFFIEAADPSAVQITKNGLPFAFQPNGGPVQ